MIAAVLLAVAVLLGSPGPDRRRLARLRGRPRRRRPGPPVIAAAASPLVGFLLLGPIGLVVGAALAPLVHRQVAALESGRSARRRAALLRQAPLALDLVAAVLAAGRSPLDAVRIVAAHSPAPLGEELATLERRVRLSADTGAAWRTLDGDVLEPVGRAFARAEISGAAIVPLVSDTAEDLRRRAWAKRRETVGRVGVRTTVPMGLCLLPAFVLVGVAPTVIAVLGSVAL